MNPASEQEPPVAGASGRCPSCDRFIGPVPICPYCGASAQRRLPLAILRYAAWALAVGGLALGYALTPRGAPPRVRIGEITPAMHFGRARVEGIVTAGPRMEGRHSATGLTFRVGDETGTILVTADAAVARALARGGRLPRRGDAVEVAGVLTMLAGTRPRLQLLAAEHLRGPSPPDGNPAAEPDARAGVSAREDP